MSRSAPVWKRDAFAIERGVHTAGQEAEPRSPHFVKREDGWILFGPYDVRGSNLSGRDRRCYQFSLQMLYADKQLRVRVACKYMTLDQAWRHCITKGRSWNRNHYQQAIAIIRLMVLQAQAYKLPHMPMHVRFDSSVVKRRK